MIFEFSTVTNICELPGNSLSNATCCVKIGSQTCRLYVIKKVPEIHGFCPPNTPFYEFLKFLFLEM